MANPPPQPPPAQRFPLSTLPGVKRDGTPLDANNWTDAQWVRFQRGRPKKMGGYRAMTAFTAGPIRNCIVDARAGSYTLHTFSQWGVEALQFDPVSGAGGGVQTRTPATYVINPLNTWQDAALVNAGGSPAYLLASATPDILDISLDTAGPLYYGDITALGTPLVAITNTGTPLTISGGICSIGPFAVIYGSNGTLTNSNPNNISDATGWVLGTGNNAFYNSANPIDKKIVKGLPIRGGSYSPTGLFWGLNALVRMAFNPGGGTFNYWKYDVLGTISVLAKNSIIEYDGVYYWLGVDRFYVYNGVIQELPNQMSLNWFFDNINRVYANKCWALKVPRFGEIWWFYPRGTATECSHAVIFNVREGTWYDTALPRTAGQEADIFPNPIMCGGEDAVAAQYLPYTVTAGAFQIGDVVTGGTSGATGTVLRVVPGSLSLTGVVGTFSAAPETITGAPSGATGTTTSINMAQEIDTVWEHEYGIDKVSAASGQLAIHAYCTTQPISFPSGGPLAQQPAPGVEYMTRLARFEPDFTGLGATRVTGNMSLVVSGAAYANSKDAADGTYVVSSPYNFSNTTPFVDTREQRRELLLTFDSDVVGGFFEMGRAILTLEQGDGRP